MNFNFQNKSEEIIKFLLNEEDKNLIISGSFALYKIHFNDLKITDIGKIIIKDIDLDILNQITEKELRNEEFINQIIENLIFEKIEKKLQKISECENIKKVEFNVKINKNNERKFNKNNFGIKIILEITDDEFETHFFKFDVGIETKDFQILNKIIKINNELKKVNVYTLEKMLADKYLALYKRFKILSIKIKENNFNEEDNYFKISKDLFDINVILNNNNNKKEEILKNIKMMYPNIDNNQILEIISFFNKLIKHNPNIFIKRGLNINFTNNIKEFDKEILNKQVDIEI